MSIIGSNVLAGASGSGVEAYQIEQSLRFDGSAYIQYPDDSFGNETGTYSFWVKRSELSAENTIFWNTRVGGHWGFRFDGANTFTLFKTASGIDSSTTTTAVFRDPSAWYHILVTTTSTANEVFVNGTSVATGSYEWAWIDANPRIGYRASDDSFQGYLAEWHYISGSVKSVSDFTETDNNGVLRPIEYEGSYGTNGYYLKFDTTDTNGILHDSSGQGNHFDSSTGFTTSGTGTDVMSDTPTTNWCTLNPLSFGPSNADMIDGNLQFNQPTSTTGNAKGTIAVSSGKWYWEVTPQTTATANVAGGILGADETSIASQPGNYATGYSYHSTGETRHNSVDATYGASYGAGDVIGTALDLDAGTLVFYKNGVSQGTAYSSVSGTFVPAIGDTSTGSNSQLVCNFGQREFAYPPGTASATDYFNAIIWTGDGSNPRTLTGVGFQPDLVWIKARSAGGDLSHQLFDSVRGLSGGNSLQPDRAVAEGNEGTGNGYLSAFTSDGFTVDTTSSDIYVNDSGKTYVAWCWKAGGTASSNTDGDITSSVSADQDAGFSVVTYTGDGVGGRTVGHGLGATLSMCIVKSRGSNSWFIRHEGLDNDRNLNFNTAAQITQGGSGIIADLGSGGSGSQQYFTLQQGSNNADNINANGTDYVAYCWTEKSGVSKFGSYTGNGSSTGPFVECGFKPRMVIVKRFDSTSNWFIYDTVRGTNNKLYAEDPSDENGEDGGSTTSNTILSLSTGFQMTSGNGSNASGGTYIFMAWAETFSADADFKSLNTANLPAPEIKDGSDYFSTTLYTGVSGSQDVDTGMATDFAWIKSRSSSQSHSLTDRVRGNDLVLQANETSAETSGNIDLTSTGVTISDDNALRGASGVTYVLWSWLAGGSVSADNNTNGTITSTVSVNATAGFSIISYSGNSTNGATIGHGLGVAPAMFIVKARTNNVSSVKDWPVFHHKMTSTPQNTKMQLNKTDAESSVSTYWNNTAPTSTVITLGTNGRVNVTNEDYICYAFAEVEGYSKFGSYTGNGNADGPFVYCGFKPAWIMVKRSSAAQGWYISDSKRDTYNQVNRALFANSSDAESSSSTGASYDFLSNGFKPKTSNDDSNGSGSTYIFAAFAEHPFGGDGVSPATAR